MHLFSKENIWSNPHASSIQSSHPDKNNNSVDRIISKEEEREDPRRELQSIFKYSGVSTFLQELQYSTRNPAGFQSSRAILHTELILLQELQGSSHAGSFQQLFSMSPSILHGRIRLPAPLQHSKATQQKQASSNSTRKKQHSRRQAASTQSLQ